MLMLRLSNNLNLVYNTFLLLPISYLFCVPGIIPIDSEQSGCAERVVLQEFDVGKSKRLSLCSIS